MKTNCTKLKKCILIFVCFLFLFLSHSQQAFAHTYAQYLFGFKSNDVDAWPSRQLISEQTFRYSVDGINVITGAATIPANAKWATLESFKTSDVGAWPSMQLISEQTFRYSVDRVNVITGAATVPANAKWATLESFKISDVHAWPSRQLISEQTFRYSVDGINVITGVATIPANAKWATLESFKTSDVGAWPSMQLISEQSNGSYITNFSPSLTLSTLTNQVLSQSPGNDTLSLTGTAKDQDIGNTISIKYSIDGVASYSNITAGILTANGSDQSFNYSITINNTVSEGTYILRVWAMDNNGEASAQSTRTFTIDNSTIGVGGQPVIKIYSALNKIFNMEPSSGAYTDVTEDFLQDNTGTGKPFFLRSYTNKISGTVNTFYDYGLTASYIDSDTIRVVTSEGKAFDVDAETGNYTDITGTFLKDNIGPGKPFYHRAYEQEVNNSGPFIFHDFGSTMAYIGDNKIRVVTSEGKAFDVDKDTGAYTEVTSTFLVNNFGSGKPFYLRTYTNTIGGYASTFYDWGTAMAYIGNDVLRVVTSEGKAFDVDVNTGVYTDITSTFLVGNFGNNKPFYQRVYPITFNGVNYTLYDFGCTMSYSEAAATTLTISSPRYLTSFDEITLTGTVSDQDDDPVTVSATLDGTEKSVVITNAATPQEWTLTWDIAADSIADGHYTNIQITKDDGNGETASATYTGTIAVYGAGSGLTRKTAHYEYDANGKLVSRYTIEN